MKIKQYFFEVPAPATREGVRAKFSALQSREEAHQEGEASLSMWSGVARLAFSEQIFPTFDMAREYIASEAAAGGPAIAARVRLVKRDAVKEVDSRMWDDPRTKLFLDALAITEDELALARAQAEDVQALAFESLKGLTKPLADCVTCGSFISRRYLRSSDCPVCEGSLLSQEESRKIQAAWTRLGQIEQRLRKERSLLKSYLGELKWHIAREMDAEEVHWVVGALIGNKKEDRQEKSANN